MTGFDSKRQASLDTLDHLPYQGRESRPDELAQPNHWREAIDAELICTHIGTIESFPTAQAALEALIDWHVAVALDPKVSSAAKALIDRGAAQPQAEPVAWDVFELRLYGAPQEKQHRVLWVDRYTYPDGSTPDLDDLLEAAKTEGGIDGGAKTLHVRPLYAAPQAAVAEPLTDEQIDEMCGEANRGFCIERDDYHKAARDTERAHGIGIKGKP